jgi:glycosyltransferase involved in cell wall biosynthesis
MKVLIADSDLFHKTGGGQTFYRNLIEKNSQIDFYYLKISEPSEANRPKNAYIIPYQEKYNLANYAKSFSDLTPPKWIYRAFVISSNIAASVAGKHFDIIDLPDYEQIGTLIRPALKHHNVDFEKIVLSMHGNISTSIQLDWFNEGKVDQTVRWQEQIQYGTVDIRYGISKTYLEEWREIINLESYYLNPLSVISLPKPQLTNDPAKLPSINFVGRTEKRKGPDIFVELAWWLPRQKFSTANIIGSDSFGPKGESSGFYLYQTAENRLKEIKRSQSLSQIELYKLFSSKSLTILPSRYDTLNIVALESLFSGCPTAIGSGAGVTGFLQDIYPQVPFITIDIKNIYSCLPEICSVLDNYDEYRQKLVDALLSSHPQISGFNIDSIYANNPVCYREVRCQMDAWYERLINFQEKQAFLLTPGELKSRTVKFVDSTLKIDSRKLAKQLKDLPIQSSKKLLNSTFFSSLKNDLKILEQGKKAVFLFDRYKQIFNLGEGSERELEEKLEQCWRVASNSRIDRVRIWREIARLERLRGNDLVAATYQVRAMRLLGCDRFGDLAPVVQTLTEQGFNQEASVAEAMYGSSQERNERCRELIERTFSENKRDRQWEYEFVDERRDLPTYRVSIIVSLYNAAAKLPLFLQTLQHQTMIQADAAEVILIDSGSPGGDYAVFKQIIESLNIPIVYARSVKRETIQSAWNRGISLARSPYLAFLGVDETILPNCLEILAAELDADPTLDWVQSNSIVTNVDKDGLWVNDIMIYDRTGYQQDLVYLETCYLSWVGALYRRDIHDRFGFYDTTFTAAGDTEFKKRILPFIKTKAITQTLGIFRNYPDERTTQSPRAEIEDLRAWYFHRTVPGIHYAFANRDPNEAEKLLYTSLRYRKSYCWHWSTDLEYAYNLATFLQERISNSPALQYQDDIKKLLDAYRLLDCIPKLSKFAPINTVFHVNNIAYTIEQKHRKIENPMIEPLYKIFNDNRHEQHSFLWTTDV